MNMSYPILEIDESDIKFSTSQNSYSNLTLDNFDKIKNRIVELLENDENKEFWNIYDKCLKQSIQEVLEVD